MQRVVSSEGVLLITVLLYWVTWTTLALLGKRSWFPLVPILPAVLVAIGTVLNKWGNWLGTVAVLSIHAVMIAQVLRCYLIARRTSATTNAPRR